MAKQAVMDYSTTPASNTDIDGTDATGATGLVKSGDNYVRSMMAHIKGYALDLGAVNTVGGTADATTVTLASNPTALADGMRLTFNAVGANTGAMTLNVTPSGGAAFGAKKVMKWSGGSEAALSANDIPAANALIEVIYDSARDTAAGAWMLIGASVAASSTTDVLTGTGTSNYATPNAIAALWEKGSDVASAGTISLGEGGFFHITGTTTITDIDFATAKDGRTADVIFDGVLTLTHNGTTLQLPGGANITTAAGDRARFVQDNNDNIICLNYVRAASASTSGLVLLTSGTVSSAATLDIVLTSYTGYRGLLFKLINFIPATDSVQLYARVSTNAGSSYDATGYTWALTEMLGNGGPTNTARGPGTNSATEIGMSGATVGNASTRGIDISVEILGQTNTALWPKLTYSGVYGDNGGTMRMITGGGMRVNAQDTDAIRFLFSSGNISSGSYAVYGLV